MLKKINCKLIITVDCGIKAIEKTNYAKPKKYRFNNLRPSLHPGPELPKLPMLF